MQSFQLHLLNRLRSSLLMTMSMSTPQNPTARAAKGNRTTKNQHVSPKNRPYIQTSTPSTRFAPQSILQLQGYHITSFTTSKATKMSPTLARVLKTLAILAVLFSAVLGAPATLKKGKGHKHSDYKLELGTAPEYCKTRSMPPYSGYIDFSKCKSVHYLCKQKRKSH